MELLLCSLFLRFDRTFDFYSAIENKARTCFKKAVLWGPDPWTSEFNGKSLSHWNWDQSLPLWLLQVHFIPWKPARAWLTEAENHPKWRALLLTWVSPEAHLEPTNACNDCSCCWKRFQRIGPYRGYIHTNVYEHLQFTCGCMMYLQRSYLLQHTIP